MLYLRFIMNEPQNNYTIRLYYMIPITYKPKQCKLIYSYIKEIRGYLEEGGFREGRMDYKGIWGNLGGDGYVHYFNCGDSFMGEHIYQNLGNWKKNKYVQFIICQFSLNKAEKVINRTSRSEKLQLLQMKIQWIGLKAKKKLLNWRKDLKKATKKQPREIRNGKWYKLKSMEDRVKRLSRCKQNFRGRREGKMGQR